VNSGDEMEHYVLMALSQHRVARTVTREWEDHDGISPGALARKYPATYVADHRLHCCDTSTGLPSFQMVSVHRPNIARSNRHSTRSDFGTTERKNPFRKNLSNAPNKRLEFVDLIL
jgi:hypothetical protein